MNRTEKALLLLFALTRKPYMIWHKKTFPDILTALNSLEKSGYVKKDSPSIDDSDMIGYKITPEGANMSELLRVQQSN